MRTLGLIPPKSLISILPPPLLNFDNLIVEPIISCVVSAKKFEWIIAYNYGVKGEIKRSFNKV